ncbi:MAG TPA: ABC transporter ATP-binding protein [Terriglobales bacterium]|jgi:branched-chain amino acid transport system ATP-binding protein|nr:ABC transporter ATP-binding protein [Terriglobales bacterium]
MLSLVSVSVNFAGLQVLEDVNLTIPEGGIFGLIGPNGAGKSTVFNLITGLLRPSAGAIEFLGGSIQGLAPFRITRAGIARTFQNIRVFKEMSVLNNVLVGSGDHSGYGAARAFMPWHRFRATEQSERATARALLGKVGLEGKAGLLAGTLSYGEQRRLEIARALATQPKLLLLDEPAAGMNSAEKQQLMSEIVNLEASGMTILIIEHDMRFIMKLCHRIAVLNFGRLIAQGTPDAIRRHPEVIEAYLGRDE